MGKFTRGSKKEDNIPKPSPLTTISSAGLKNQPSAIPGTIDSNVKKKAAENGGTVQAYRDFNQTINSNKDSKKLVELNEKGSELVHKAFMDAFNKPESFHEDAEIISNLTPQFAKDVAIGKIVRGVLIRPIFS